MDGPHGFLKVLVSVLALAPAVQKRKSFILKPPKALNTHISTRARWDRGGRRAYASCRSWGTGTVHLKKESLVMGLFGLTGRRRSKVTISL